MGGESEPAGMGDSLAVDDKYIRLYFEFFDGGDTGRCFAKREQAGNVGEGNFL